MKAKSKVQTGRHRLASTSPFKICCRPFASTRCQMRTKLTRRLKILQQWSATTVEKPQPPQLDVWIANKPCATSATECMER